MSRLEIVVDELVVRGLSPREAREAAAALETRLAALAAEAGADAVPQRTEAYRRLAAIDVPRASPGGLGEAVAGAVWSAVARGGGR